MTTLSAPVWVAHPDDPAVKIDVAPLFNALLSFDAPVNSPVNEGAAIVIRRTLRRLNLSEHNPALVTPGELVDLYQDLHRMEDMFTLLVPRPEGEA